LSAAGLAAWVLAKNNREREAALNQELQAALDAALSSGSRDAVRVSRATVEGAATVWATAAALLESWSASVGGDAEADRQAVRLRRRVRSLHAALDAH
jgi:hypothetical protein